MKEWISCKKEMPKENEYVIGTILIHLDADEEFEAEDNLYIGIGSIKNGFDFEHGTTYVDGIDVRLLAWMPLPDIYEGE